MYLSYVTNYTILNLKFSDNGTLDFEEFEKFLIEKDILNKHPDEVSLEIMEAFNVFDKNGDGYIDFDELKVVLTQIGEYMAQIVEYLMEMNEKMSQIGE